MMRIFRSGFVALALLCAPAAFAQTADFEADAALVKSAVSMGSATAGQGPGDKVLMLGRGADGEANVVGLSMGAPSADAMANESTIVAVIWVRPGAPNASDGAFAAKAGKSLFVVGDSSRKIWEVARRGGVMQYRQVSPKASDWKQW